jgi:hypothetical protein
VVADDHDDDLRIHARAISTLNISRAASDLADIRISRWSTDAERDALVDVLADGGNTALAAALTGHEEVGWFQFDPRGGGGPGRNPRRATLRYAREFGDDQVKEITLVTNHFIGYSQDPRAADGSKLKDYPISLVMLKLERSDNGEWKGVGRVFVGAKIRFDAANRKFVIDEFPNDPVFLKDVRVK